MQVYSQSGLFDISNNKKVYHENQSDFDITHNNECYNTKNDRKDKKMK